MPSNGIGVLSPNLVIFGIVFAKFGFEAVFQQ
jgi:hypothetical protein